MALGDISDSTKVADYIRFDGRAKDTHAEALFLDPIFNFPDLRYPKQKPKTGFAGWVFRPFGHISRMAWISLKRLMMRLVRRIVEPEPRAGRSGRLVDILTHVTSRVTLGTPVSINTWEVPFADVVLQSPLDGVCDKHVYGEDLDSRAANNLTAQLSNYLPSGQSIRVRCLVNEALEIGNSAGSLVQGYIGGSIFAAEPGSEPVGWVRYYQAGDQSAKPFEPRYSDGSRAGIFRDQSAMGFAISDPLQPVNLSLPLTQTPSNIWCTLKGIRQTPAKDQAKPGTKLPVLAYLTDRKKLNVRLEPHDSPVPQDDLWVDQRFNMIAFNTDHSLGGSLDICLDARVSRLRYAPVTDSDVAIDAIRINRSEMPAGAQGIWLNFDAFQQLVFSNLQFSRYSICWRFDFKSTTCVDWGRPAHLIKQNDLGIFAKGDRTAVTFRRRNGEPFGYLSPSKNASKVSFQADTASPDRYALDWLNASGGVLLGEERIGLAKAYAVGADVISSMLCDCDASTEETVGPLYLTRSNPRRPEK